MCTPKGRLLCLYLVHRARVFELRLRIGRLHIGGLFGPFLDQVRRNLGRALTGRQQGGVQLDCRLQVQQVCIDLVLAAANSVVLVCLQDDLLGDGNFVVLGLDLVEVLRDSRRLLRVDVRTTIGWVCAPLLQIALVDGRPRILVRVVAAAEAPIDFLIFGGVAARLVPIPTVLRPRGRGSVLVAENLVSAG